MRRPWLLAIAALLALAVAGAAMVIWPRRNSFEMPRASNGESYVLYTHVPDQCRSGGCPALYLLDGLAWLSTFAKLDDELAADHRIQPVVIIGIGYQNLANTGDLRKRDFTPAFGRTPARTGGADAFLAVLRNEIIPYAEARLPIRGTERAIAGHSYGGLFVTYALARAPDLFDRAMIMSPALWFDNGEIYNVAFEPAPNPREVFLAADTPRGQARSAMANDTLRLSTLLSAHPDISVSHALIFGESHMSMVEPAARRGLRALYGSELEQ